uniref:Amelotin n=1 Tax=Leptobrachium leishanense TaxID=445787 RepID=A0A8C5MRY7_9ANUR
MNFFVILAHLLGTSLAIPLVAHRLLSASNSNEGGAMNMLVPRVLQNQLRQQGFPQLSFNGQFHPLLTPKLGIQPVIIDPAMQKTQNQQQPNQMMPYIVSYGVPQQPGQAFGCVVPQFTGDVMKLEIIPPGALQLPTKNPTTDDAIFAPGASKPDDKGKRCQTWIYQCTHVMMQTQHQHLPLDV